MLLGDLGRVPLDGVEVAIEADVVRLPRDSTVAVIRASSDVARRLERDLRERPTGQFRETRCSAHTDLVRRLFVHFTTALDAKGLEFDAVIVPWIGHIDLADPLVANAAYVAMSRPRQQLFIILPPEVDDPFERWATEGILETVLDPVA